MLLPMPSRRRMDWHPIIRATAWSTLEWLPNGVDVVVLPSFGWQTFSQSHASRAKAKAEWGLIGLFLYLA